MSTATHQVDEVAEVLLDLLGRQTPHQVEGTVQLLLSLKQTRSHADGEKDRWLHTTLENHGRLCKCVHADDVKSVVRLLEVGGFKCLCLYIKKKIDTQTNTDEIMKRDAKVFHQLHHQDFIRISICIENPWTQTCSWSTWTFTFRSNTSVWRAVQEKRVKLPWSNSNLWSLFCFCL